MFEIYAPHTQTQVLRRRRCWLMAASTIDWSNCGHSSIRRLHRRQLLRILFSV